MAYTVGCTGWDRVSKLKVNPNYARASVKETKMLLPSICCSYPACAKTANGATIACFPSPATR